MIDDVEGEGARHARAHDQMRNRIGELHTELLKAILVIAAGFDSLSRFTAPSPVSDHFKQICKGLDDVIVNLTPPKDDDDGR